jgi:hypothetical protein
MKIPGVTDSRLPRLADDPRGYPPGTGKERGYLWSAAGRVLILAALFVPLPWIGNAQQVPPAAALADDEPLAEKVTDPLSHLTQIQIKDPYTPAEYGTNAQPNTIQLRAIFAVRHFSFIPVEQLVRPTIRVVTVPDGKGASTTTAYDDMQLLDLFAMPWPNSRETHLRWGIGSYLVFPTASSDRIGKGSWQMGPAGAFSYRGIPGLKVAGLLQQATSFTYTSPKSVPVSSLTFQPILTYQIGHGWYLKSSHATWTFNLRHNTSTTIPLSCRIRQSVGTLERLRDRYLSFGRVDSLPAICQPD